MLITTPIATKSVRIESVNFIVGTIFIVLMVYGCVSQALPVEKSISKQSEAARVNLTQSTVWYDGPQQRKLWMNHQLVAEFGGGADDIVIMYKNAPGSTVRYIRESVRIWEMSDQQVAGKLLTRAKSSASKTHSVYSPVLHETQSGSSRMWALPGNIIVYLDPVFDQVKVNQWMQTHGFEVVKKLEIRPNAFVLKTGPGMEALLLANQLYESGDVVAAFPDWWLESVMR